MDITAVTRGDCTIVEGIPGKQLLQSPDDIVDIIGACFENSTQALLLYAENLTSDFFDLSSGDAGSILQKLRNYRIRLAIVLPTGGVRQSPMFGEMLIEESKAGDFRIFENKDLAETWLAGE
jgi:Domain of unknown function (DUF4180)